MTTEQNQPQPPAENGAQASNQPQGQHPGHGGHRRRRRRKRNKGGSQAQGQNPSQQSPAQNQQPPQPQAQKPKHKQQPPSSQQRFFKNGNGQGGQGGGGRRRNKQRRERVFVGPMDHSYRTVNGNVADSPPSHMEYRNGNVNGNINGNGYSSESAGREAPPPVREDAPTRIYFFVEDLFFFAKINESARKLGIKVAFVKNEPETIAKIVEAPEDGKPSLIVFDLNNAAAKPMTLIPKLKTKLKKGTAIIGFLSHLQGDLKAKAVEAGCDVVMPRSAFSQNLPNLLRRHGLDEAEEMEYAQA